MTAVTFDKNAADLLLSKAKIAVMKDPKLVFFSVLMMNMRYAWRMSIPTAATDGRTIYINPVSYADLTPGQRVSRLMHEVMHCALCHLLRKGSKNHQKWNRACDFYINLMLTDQGFERIPTWLWNDGYRGLSSEQIYDALPEEPEDNFDPDLMPPGESDEPSRPEEVQYTMDKLVLQATMQAQKAGCATGVPSDIAFYLQALLNPKLPWEIILKRWFGKYNRKGYSWKKPNKRFNDDYMPSRGRPGFEHAAFATDISGSVSDDDYNRIVSEVAGCMDRMKPTWIHYLQFSETITSISKVKTTRELKKIKFVGRGGTDVRELFEWADKNKPKVLVILTDGEFYWPRENQNDPFDEASPYILPSCDVVWLIHDNPDFVSHYGKVIHYEINK